MERSSQGEGRESLVARRLFSPDKDLYLLDHTLGRSEGLDRRGAGGLAILPLAVSMEIIAEAGACLCPELTVIGICDLRANRWIIFDDMPQELEVSARRLPEDDHKVLVSVRNLTEDGQGGAPKLQPVVEATVILGKAYPAAPGREPTRLEGSRASRLRPERLYRDHMFHGPLWRGVERIEEVSPVGATASLRVLPSASLVREIPDPGFVLDPVTIDAAGQVIGFWSAEQLVSRQVVFPFRFRSLELFRARLPELESLSCSVRIQLDGEWQIRSDIEVRGGDGGVWFRLTGWEDRRFDLPAELHPLIVPALEEFSKSWGASLEQVTCSSLLECRHIEIGGLTNQGIWQRIWAHRILSRAERDRLRRMGLAEDQQLAWLAGRTAAKEAVLRIINRQARVDLSPSDIELLADEDGCLVPTSDRLGIVAEVPRVAISLCDGHAFALAALPATGGRPGPAGHARPGIHVEPAGRTHIPGQSRARWGEDVRLPESVPHVDREDWRLRARCSEQAVISALGGALFHGQPRVRSTDVDLETGLCRVSLDGSLAVAYPELAREPLIVLTGLDDGWVWATTLCEHRISEADDGPASSGRGRVELLEFGNRESEL
ncbi:MAG: polyketide synthase dehydratase domain-containing protein [Isosphaeraceae bacterium]